jgi:hypothetical protein
MKHLYHHDSVPADEGGLDEEYEEYEAPPGFGAESGVSVMFPGVESWSNTPRRRSSVISAEGILALKVRSRPSSITAPPTNTEDKGKDKV